MRVWEFKDSTFLVTAKDESFQPKGRKSDTDGKRRLNFGPASRKRRGAVDRRWSIA